MLRKVESTSACMMLIVDLSFARVVQHSPFQFYTSSTCLSDRWCSASVCACACMTFITLHVQNLTLLTEMIMHPTNIRISIYTYKTASCLSYIRGLLRLDPNYCKLLTDSSFSMHRATGGKKLTCLCIMISCLVGSIGI